MSPRTGRPKVENPKVHIGVRIDAELERKLNAFCNENGMTRTEAVEKGIHLLLAKEKEQNE